MAYVYRKFIPQNTAPKGAKSIGVYKGDKRIFTIPLGGLTPANGMPNYSFGLISDIHCWEVTPTWNGNEKFDNALTFFEEKGCLFCAHCGDITQTGLYAEGDKVNLAPSQFEKYKEICDKHSIPVYGICGNHESYVNPITNNPTELDYYTGTGQSEYYTKTQGNDLFIFIGQPSYNEVMSDTALQWLQNILENNRNKRCFVFIHPYIEEDSGDPLDLRENSVFDEWGTTKTNAFISIMQQYDNAVLFHGHSHTKYECQELDINANYTERNGFKSVHIPSVGKPRYIEGNTTPEDNNGSQGYIVDVYDDCIVLNGMDLINKTVVPIGTYKINVAEGT